MFKQVLPSVTNDRRWGWFILEAVLLLTILGLAFMKPLSADPLANGGTGPGGVGVTNGGDTLKLWLQSDKLVYSDSVCSTVQTTDGNPVGCWRDYSGNGNHAIQATAANQPTLQNGTGDTLNGHPMLRWDGSNDFLGTSMTVNLAPFTVFVVFNATNTGFIYEHNIASFTNGGSYLLTETGGTHSVTRLPGPTESWRNLTSGWGSDGNYRIVAQTFNGTNASHNMYINGTLQTTTPVNTVDPGLNAINAALYIGDRGSGTPVYHINGNYGEFVLYSEALNSAQRLIITNYLQAKFNDSAVNNISLGLLDRYDGDTTTNNNHDRDVAGIGQETDGSHTEAHSAGLIVQDNGFLQDNGDYLMVGHRTPVNGNGSIYVPGGWGADARYWERDWYIDVTDVVGTANGLVTLIFDFSEGGMGGSNPNQTNVTDYRLLARTGIASQFTDIATATGVSGDQVTFSVNVSALTPYTNFTLGSIDAVSSPTAVEMQNAAALSPTSFWSTTSLIVLALSLGTWLTLRQARKVGE